MSKPKSTYGIIGYPIEHSLSPVIHNTAFQALNVDAEYVTFPLKENELEDFFKKLRDKESPVFGLNVTVPYKEKVIPYMDSLSPFAEKINAVNTIVITDDRKLSGYNTDGPGFLTHLTEINFDIKGKHIAILGAGGTARAILATFCLLSDRPQAIKVYNRTEENLSRLLSDLQSRMDTSIIEAVGSIDDLNIELADILVNTTSLGMNTADHCLVDEGLLHANMLVYDVIYNPAETKLIKLAKQKGAQTSNGLGMLFYQGILAFGHWSNVQLDEHVKNEIRHKLEEAQR